MEDIFPRWSLRVRLTKAPLELWFISLTGEESLDQVASLHQRASGSLVVTILPFGA